MARSFESRVLEERRKLRVTPEELRERVAASNYGPKTKQVLEKTISYESTTTMGFSVFECPPVMDVGEGSIVYDVDGKEYIDCLTGFSVSNVGLCNPEVVEVINAQSRRLIHYFDLPSVPRAEFSKRITEVIPGSYSKKVMYAVTGSEIVEATMRLARWYTGRQFIISFYGAYHGRTAGAMALTGGKGAMWAYYYPVLPADSGVAWFPYAYCYRCYYGKEYPSCDIQCVKVIDDLLKGKESPFRDPRNDVTNVAAIFVEPMQGSAGYIIPPDEFLRRLEALCKKYGILFVVDEIQTGMGRSGKMWAVEHSGVIPDIITIGKAVAAGLPMSLAVGTAEIMDSWGPGAHMGTFAGYPLACAVANKVLEIIKRDKLVEQAAVKGQYFLNCMQDLYKKRPVIGDVSGKGLFLSMELVRDRKTKEPAGEAAAHVQQQCLAKGVLIARSGHYANRLYFIPSLTITEDQIERVLRVVDESLQQVERTLAI